MLVETTVSDADKNQTPAYLSVCTFAAKVNAEVKETAMNPNEVLYRGKYLWQRQKNEINIWEHTIAFEEAVRVFDVPFS